MLRTIREQARPALLMLFWMTLLTGLAYPLAMTGLGNLLFPDQASGSLVRRDGAVVGSGLIGQPFASDRYFWGRPSATAPQPGNAAASAGSNLGPSNPELAEQVSQRVERLKAAHGDVPVPMDLATASASGLDPHISPQAARYQVERVAKARGQGPRDVAALVERHVERGLLGVWGEPRVNVLALNLALDEMAGTR